MDDVIKISEGDVFELKKKHPCGSKLWEIIRIGIEFKMKCNGCGHIITLPREKAIKMISKKAEKL